MSSKSKRNGGVGGGRMDHDGGAGLLVSVTASLTANSRSGDGCLFSHLLIVVHAMQSLLLLCRSNFVAH